ncbi:sulfurtransferase [Acaryochloris sp. IP29b_bin.148]|uniref:sulfurtransferase n=1 Tax=Acaryochloris sp. IP29b_bin.148 TaxID=2969218 RepID=UPI00262539D0|nr:sulfurtransferase [Acaryochloris sp. IP29b_bin.148]
MAHVGNVVSPQWLHEHLHDAQVVIVDCRFALSTPQQGREQYQAGHIPGAYYLDLNQDLSSPVQTHGGRHPLPNSSQFAAKLSQMGITSETWVVAYDDSRQAFASRLWWLLRYLGHKKVAVLDGGWAAYQAHYSVITDIPEVRSGKFQASPNPSQVVDIQTVKAHKDQPNVTVVDSRAYKRYLGNHEPIDPVAGHIPGAVNYPWQAVTDEQGYLLPISKLQAHYADLENVDEVIVYCGSGVTACVNLLALDIAGVTSGKLYAGSWSDWCSYPLDHQMEAQISQC